jgi:hypothetical protein
MDKMMATHWKFSATPKMRTGKSPHRRAAIPPYRPNSTVRWGMRVKAFVENQI